jgi:hypothetical protein
LENEEKARRIAFANKRIKRKKATAFAVAFLFKLYYFRSSNKNFLVELERYKTENIAVAIPVQQPPCKRLPDNASTAPPQPYKRLSKSK